VLRFDVSVEDLLHSRFALSPALDPCLLLRSLAGQGPPLPRAWATRLPSGFERLRRETELDAVLALQTPRGGPNFVAPPPRGLNRPGQTTSGPDAECSGGEECADDASAGGEESDPNPQVVADGQSVDLCAGRWRRCGMAG